MKSEGFWGKFGLWLENQLVAAAESVSKEAETAKSASLAKVAKEAEPKKATIKDKIYLVYQKGFPWLPAAKPGFLGTPVFLSWSGEEFHLTEVNTDGYSSLVPGKLLATISMHGIVSAQVVDSKTPRTGGAVGGAVAGALLAGPLGALAGGLLGGGTKRETYLVVGVRCRSRPDERPTVHAVVFTGTVENVTRAQVILSQSLG